MGGVGSGGCAVGNVGDADGDGFSVADGDCNDCDGAQNPGAFDVVGNRIDEDCNGVPDDEILGCDGSLPDAGDAVDAARAIGICRRATAVAVGKARSWGLIAARYVFPNGSLESLPTDIASECAGTQISPNDLSHGILSGFGPNVRPQQGGALLAISSGVARAGKQAVPNGGGFSPEQGFMCTRSLVPEGFPVSSYATCGDLPNAADSRAGDPKSAYDGVALELVIRAPTNAKALAFDFDFYTFEYTDFVCSAYNDTFAALLYSRSPDTPTNHSIAFDSQGNPVSVNNGFVEVCEPFVYEGTRGGAPFSRVFDCQYGTSELAGTGFEGDATGPPRAATSWLRTRANVVGGEELTLRFAIWDAGDEWFDSTALIDNFTWEVVPGETGTIRPPPE